MQILNYLLGLGIIVTALWACNRFLKLRNYLSFLHILIVIAVSLFVLEIALNAFYYKESKSWLFLQAKHPNRNLFEKHPYLGVTNKANADEKSGNVRIQHNQRGLRGVNYSDEEISNSFRILTIGGSTTYGVGVNNNETWPHYLDSLLGPDSLVINLSVPGHSTVEHLITAALYLEEYKPDALIVLAGLNDLRCSHVENLKSDYSNFHEPHLVGSMGQCYLENIPKIATLFYVIRFAQHVGMYPICDFHRAVVSGEQKTGIDQKSLQIYRQNLGRLIHMCRYYTKDILIMPQVLIDENVADNGLEWWIPFVPANELISLMSAYNDVTREEALSNSCVYVDSVSTHPWNAQDFVDPSHFNARANKQLAIIVKDALKEFSESSADSLN